VYEQVRRERVWYFTEQPAPAPHLAHPEGYDALRIVLVTVLLVSRSCEHFPDGFDIQLLQDVVHKTSPGTKGLTGYGYRQG